MWGNPPLIGNLYFILVGLFFIYYYFLPIGKTGFPFVQKILGPKTMKPYQEKFIRTVGLLMGMVIFIFGIIGVIRLYLMF